MPNPSPTPRLARGPSSATGSSLTFTGPLTLTSSGSITVTNSVFATGDLTASAVGPIIGSGGIGTTGTLTLTASSVGSPVFFVSQTPFFGAPLAVTGTTPLTAVTLSGTVTGTAQTDAFNVQSTGTITVGTITAIAGDTGHPIRIVSTGGAILSSGTGSGISGGQVILGGTSIGAVGSNLAIATTQPSALILQCGGGACNAGSTLFTTISTLTLGNPGLTLELIEGFVDVFTAQISQLTDLERLESESELHGSLFGALYRFVKQTGTFGEFTLSTGRLPDNVFRKQEQGPYIDTTNIKAILGSKTPIEIFGGGDPGLGGRVIIVPQAPPP